MMKSHVLGLLLSLFAMTVGCVSPDDNSTELSRDPLDGSLLANLPTLGFGDSYLTSVADEFAMVARTPELVEGDTLQVTLDVSRIADSQLEITLVSSTGTPVQAQAPARGMREYSIESNGAHVLIIRELQEEPVVAINGSNNATLAVRLTCSECARNEEPLSAAEVDRCLTNALVCALSEIENDRVGDTTSGVLLQSCLTEQTLSSGKSCASTCETELPQSELPPARVCSSLRGELRQWADVLYGDYPNSENRVRSACLEHHVGACIGECARNMASVNDQLFDGVIQQCWLGPWGTCNAYAAAHEDCGGEGYNDQRTSTLQWRCDAWCTATHGDESCRGDCVADVCAEDVYDLCEDRCEPLPGDDWVPPTERAECWRECMGTTCQSECGPNCGDED